jgi:hypothetical protein
MEKAAGLAVIGIDVNAIAEIDGYRPWRFVCDLRQGGRRMTAMMVAAPCRRDKPSCGQKNVSPPDGFPIR